eukprot:CAMPEP_0177768534 /NCGR_PEP_ID=MMETSP0491_2-20121128/9776_1 /TAXON_ID=63592 /ORGANISM="Tetraselmis chuii, Strain PLY429" /LENGTH=420 /DNA_ID=CAMNT_0019285355 /DNA_START=148 /DNA_END=1410 /DNA_ORIENTATION=+
MAGQVNVEALKSEVRQALVNHKAIACPMAVRLAWHMSGTFDTATGTGGSDGATARYEPERSDPANAGLFIIIDLLHDVKKAHPEISHADLWTAAGVMSLEFLGGPKVPFKFGRRDAQPGCPMRPVPENGRLPDASQGAEHLREVFGRQGFSDREIVALSGAHTLGRCHKVRSGYDGKWTHNPLKFDNEYFRNLMFLDWRPRKWEGPFQYEDMQSQELVMLPSDMALKEDPEFRKYAELYARDNQAFFRDFARAYAKLLSNGGPPTVCPFNKSVYDEDDDGTTEAKLAHYSAEFREHAMHGSIEHCKKYVALGADVHSVEGSSGRTALHKAAFWGHEELVAWLAGDLNIDVNARDYYGDTALHDAARFGHAHLISSMLENGADVCVRNQRDETALNIAIDHGHEEVVRMLKGKGAAACSRL